MKRGLKTPGEISKIDLFGRLNCFLVNMMWRVTGAIRFEEEMPTCFWNWQYALKRVWCVGLCQWQSNGALWRLETIFGLSI